jgi:hypothetical protein
MNGRIRIQRPGAFESPPGMLSEIDHALALIGTAHWIGRFKAASEAKPRAATLSPLILTSSRLWIQTRKSRPV